MVSLPVIVSLPVQAQRHLKLSENLHHNELVINSETHLGSSHNQIEMDFRTDEQTTTISSQDNLFSRSAFCVRFKGQSGHIICHPCSDRLLRPPLCPSCKSHLSDRLRNRKLEKLSKITPTSCDVSVVHHCTPTCHPLSPAPPAFGTTLTTTCHQTAASVAHYQRPDTRTHCYHCHPPKTLRN